MSWRSGSLLLMKYWDILVQDIGDKKEREEIGAGLVKLFIANDIDPYDIQDHDDELDEILAKIFDENREPSESHSSQDEIDKDDAEPVKLTYIVKDGSHRYFDPCVHDLSTFKNEIVERDYLKFTEGMHEHALDYFYKNYHLKHGREIFYYLLQLKSEEYDFYPANFLYKMVSWSVIKNILQDKVLPIDQIPLSTAIRSIFKSEGAVDDYQLLAELYEFSDGKTADEGLYFLHNVLGQALICPKVCYGKHLHGQKIPYKKKTKDCLEQIPLIEDLISWHTDNYSIQNLESTFDAEFFVTHARCSSFLEGFLKQGLNPDTRLRFIDVNFANNKATLLMAASAFGNLKGAKLLVEHGADIHAVDDYSHSALDFAKKKKKASLINYLETICNPSES